MRSFEVYVLTVGFDNVCCDVACYLEHVLVVLDGVVVVNWRVLILVLVFEVALLELDNTLHLRMIEIEVELRMICIIISHFVYLLFCL